MAGASELWDGLRLGVIAAGAVIIILKYRQAATERRAAREKREKSAP